MMLSIASDLDHVFKIAANMPISSKLILYSMQRSRLDEL